jgi:hypothetical protein
MSPRKHIPLKVKLDAALRQLGLNPQTAELDHHPALFLRERTPEGNYIPDENDPAAMVWRSSEDHAKKTYGRGKGERGTVANGDIHRKAKIDRIVKARDAMADASRRMASGAPKNERPKSKWPSRPFPKRPKG